MQSGSLIIKCCGSLEVVELLSLLAVRFAWRSDDRLNTDYVGSLGALGRDRVLDVHTPILLRDLWKKAKTSEIFCIRFLS